MRGAGRAPSPCSQIFGGAARCGAAVAKDWRELGRDDDMGGRGDRDAMGERLAGQIGVEQRDDAADLGDAEPDGEIFRPVGHQQADGCRPA